MTPADQLGGCRSRRAQAGASLARAAGLLALSLSLSLAVSLLSGCASKGKAPAKARAAQAPIDRISLICRPVALNLDDAPGTDGVGLTLYASSATAPKTLRITQGTVEIRLYDGALKPADLLEAQPLSTWTFTAEDLEKFVYTGSIGACYPLPIRWGAKKPRQNWVTVTARFTPPEGPVFQSHPNIISMLVQ